MLDHSERCCVTCGADISHRKSTAIVCSTECYSRHWYSLHGAKQREERKEYTRDWAALNKQKLKKYRSQYYKTNRNRLREAQKEYYLKNTDDLKAKAKAWKDANREYVASRDKKKIDQNISEFLCKTARKRAQEKGLPFNLTPDDLPVPENCPVLGIPLGRGNGKPFGGSPSVDRFIPELGYVKGNVAVISHRANSLKSNACAEELMCLLLWMLDVQTGVAD